MPPSVNNAMKIIDLTKAESYRKEWERMAVLWDKEADSRAEKARTDAAKYRITHLDAAKDARRNAKHFRNLIEDLDKQVAAHKAAGKVVE